MLTMILAFVAGGTAEAVASLAVHHFVGHRAPAQRVELGEETRELLERSVAAHNHHLTERIRDEIRRHHVGGGGFVR